MSVSTRGYIDIPLKWTDGSQLQQTLKHVTVRCCKIIQHTWISLGSLDSCKWEESDGVMCFHGCFSGQFYFVWDEETNCVLLYGREKFSKFRVIYHLDYFLCMWFSTTAMLRGRSSGSPGCSNAASANKVMCQAAGQTAQAGGQSLFQESERTVINI